MSAAGAVGERALKAPGLAVFTAAGGVYNAAGEHQQVSGLGGGEGAGLAAVGTEVYYAGQAATSFMMC